MKNVKSILACFLGVMALMFIFVSANANAAAFQLGDVFAAVDNGNVQQWRGGVLIDTLNTTRPGFTTGMATDSAGNLYVTNFTDSSVSKFDSDGNLVAAQWAVTDAGANVESILFDKAGDFYVGQAGGTRDILKGDAAGSITDRFDVAIEDRGSDWIDLAADQSTMFYTSEGRYIKRYDVATHTQLPDFADLNSGTAYALRLLSDGGLLVADTTDIKRLDSTGTVIQTYDVENQDYWFALNLDPNGSSFWSGDVATGKFYEFDINSGDLLGTFDTEVGGYHLWGLGVYGEITEGGGGVTGVPEPATFLLLGTGLIGLAGFRKKLFKKS